MAYTERCIHELNPAWCAICKGLKTPEEEQAQMDKSFVVHDQNCATGENLPFCNCSAAGI